jgi:RHS repeat-associated protein
VEDQAEGVQRRTALEPTGALTESLIRPDGTQRLTSPDGTVVDLAEGPDPRWGMQAPIVKTLSVDPPTGAPLTRTFARAVTLANPPQPLSMTAQTDTVKFGNDTTTIAWNGTAKTFTLTSPASRTITLGVDALRRGTSLAMPGVATQTWTYDVKGQLQHYVQGGQDTVFEHDAQHRFAARTNPAGHRLEVGYDAADRRISVELPTSRTWAFGWDANDNMTQVTPPGGSAHALAYDAADALVGYTPPGGSAHLFPTGIDGRPESVSLPGPRSEDLTYDAGGRPTGAVYDEATVTVAYAAGDETARPDVITRTPAGGGTAQQYDRDWNGELPTAARFVGPASGAFAYQYDASYRLSNIALASAPDDVAVAYAYDADDLRTTIGPFTLTRSGPLGAPTTISDGTGVLTYGYDAFGRIASRRLTVNSVVVYDATVEFDAAGRISMQTETDATGTHVFLYGWDDDGQLVQVKRDGLEVEAYAYDERGNRTSRSLDGGGAEVATFDGQDHLLTRGALAYGSDGAGFLAQRGPDAFTYSAVGELLSSNAGGGVTYGYDGLRRRVTRTAGGQTTQYLYGNPENDVEVSAVRDPSAALTWYHHDDGGRLVALQRGASRYYVATDATGSPRVIADPTGAVVRRRRWDAFGNLVEDTAPGFHVALGFAGGLDDAATGLVRFGLRDYEPASGRWTSRDPVLFAGAQGNLYAYVRNHPVGSADPSGLAAGSLSVYEGIGIDLKWSVTRDGFSACTGGGFGGGGIMLGIDPFADLDDDGLSFDAHLKGRIGPAKVDLGVEFSPCRNYNDISDRFSFKPKASACVGAACTKLDKWVGGEPNLGVKARLDEDKSTDFKAKGDVKSGVSGKFAAKVCQQIKW